MSRNIKFRCWNIEEEIMHDVAFPTWNGGIEVWSDNIPQSSVQYLSMNGEVQEGVLLQYTGLHDINGAEVYEGDIMFGQYVGYNEMKWSEDRSGWVYYHTCLDEIKGNIHQNPELIK